MKVCIIGGLQRRENEYLAACKQIGCKAKVFNEMSNSFENSIKCTNCVVFLTTLSSHNMINKAKNICRRHDIPFICTDRTSPESVSCIIKEAMGCKDDCKGCLLHAESRRAN
ncbi:DUF2325 domain-containing protein [Seleniivibrio woodruffii]|jgi:hypothetical protein|uniref:DUF2325 domain-containing protein n=1 Tax=Seleniivibrio woodruffii TaxID=1078050 RepID=UPI0026ED3479|nr:DUF2325 domain-containing protein [Seleniivibrio woodruffii]